MFIAPSRFKDSVSSFRSEMRLMKPDISLLKERGTFLHNSSINISLLAELTRATCSSVWYGHSLPTHQVFLQRLIHIVKRIGAKQNRLEMGRVIFLARCSIQIERLEFGVVHLFQLSC